MLTTLSLVSTPRPTQSTCINQLPRFLPRRRCTSENGPPTATWFARSCRSTSSRRRFRVCSWFAVELPQGHIPDSLFSVFNVPSCHQTRSSAAHCRSIRPSWDVHSRAAAWQALPSSTVGPATSVGRATLSFSNGRMFSIAAKITPVALTSRCHAALHRSQLTASSASMCLPMHPSTRMLSPSTWLFALTLLSAPFSCTPRCDWHRRRPPAFLALNC